MNNQSGSVNIFSPDMEDYQEYAFDDVDIPETPRQIRLRRKRATIERNLDRLVGRDITYAHNNARGSFDYDVDRVNTKKQIYSINIVDGHDAVLIALLLLRFNLIRRDKLPVSYLRVYDILQSAGGGGGQIFYSFLDNLYEYLGKRVMHNKIMNPKTKRKIKYRSATYRKIFRSIKLRDVIDIKQQHLFNIIDYIVSNHCVPSFFKKVLGKKKWKIVCKELNKNKTPTYPELTKILNKVNIGLNVIIVDGEELQRQKFKKMYSILIHNGHMYVLGRKRYMSKKVKKVDEAEFYNIEKSVKGHSNLGYSKSSIYKDGIKYKLDNAKYTDINKVYKMLSTYSINNIDFYYNSKIRPIRYFDKKVKRVSQLDINGCYKNILNNETYVFGVQTGDEYIEKYNNRIVSYGFYFCIFKKMNYIQSVVFNKYSWIKGDIITKLKLKHITIKYQLISKKAVRGRKTKYNKIDMAMFSGYLAKFNKYKYKMYDTTCDKEREGLVQKYSVDAYTFKNKAIIRHDKYMKKCGLFSYLSVVSYAHLQLYQLYEELSKKKKVKVYKIYTDSLGIDIQINNKQLKALNKQLLKKYNFTVKKEHKSFVFNTTIRDPTEPTIEKRKLKMYKRDDVEKLLKKNVSFDITGRAGYGKSWTIKNVIIPYLKKNKKKYLITSTTTDNALEYNSKPIHHYFFTKTRSLNNIKKFFEDIDYIIVDEASQSTSDILMMLHNIKNYSNVNIITVGDNNQCGGIDKMVGSWMNSKQYFELIDYNRIELQWIETGRYDKEYDTFLDNIIKIYNHTPHNKKKVYSFVAKKLKKYICKEKDDDNDMYLVYTHKKGEMVEKKRKINYRTVHSVQGKTINNKYSIYEWDRMPIEVLYTALSRGTKKSDIKIMIK